MGSFTLGLGSDRVCSGLETVHGRQGKEKEKRDSFVSRELSVGATERNGV